VLVLGLEALRMTNQPQSATILKFPATQRLDDATLHLMHQADCALTNLTTVFEIEAGNVREGANLSRGGAILNGRAMVWACNMLLHLIALRGNRPSDRALAREIRSWKNDWKPNA
jgi:hypothetical protein